MDSAAVEKSLNLEFVGTPRFAASVASRAPRVALGYGGADLHPRAGVVDVALRVPQRRLVLRLRGRRGVPGADEDLVLSGHEVDGDLPMPPGPRAEVLEQLGLRPG